MSAQEQITQLTADLAECRKWLKEANLKFDGKRAYLAAAEIDRMVAEYFSNASTSSIKEDIAAIILRHFPHDETVLTLDELEKI